MTAIYKKELKSYLTSMIGYLFMAFTLALFGLYFTAINLQQGYPEIGYALQNFRYYPWKISGTSHHLCDSSADYVPVSAASWNPRNSFLRCILHFDPWLFPAGSSLYFGRCVRFLHHREPGHRSRCRLCDPVLVLRGERYRKLLPGRSRKLFLCFLYHHCTGMPLDRQYD